MKPTILIVEDEDPKRANIISALSELNISYDLIEARSVLSAINCLRATTPELILLDMSLPTFDIAPRESGGRPQGFGGVEVLRYIDRFGLSVPVIVVTAYEAFSQGGKQIGLNDLGKQLLLSHGAVFSGMIYYNSVYEKWREDLQKLVREVLKI